ncbi:MAG: hypothetical protein J6B92_04090 [Paraprevotella sp.]|nr:hypothetical protein [Paraprevotella sp.]
MKKNYLSSACLLAGAVVMFSSCSSDDDIIVANEGNAKAEPVQTITLAVANTGDNFLNTRASRPLYSTEAKQDINKVKVVIYKLEDEADTYGAKTIVAEKTFTPWMNGGVSSTYSNGSKGHGRQASWTLSTADMIKEEGKYLAYAVGYNDEEYTAIGTFDGVNKENSSFTFPLNVEQPADATIKEVFAGSTVFEVKNNNNGDTNVEAYEFNVSLTLHRQVAGIVGYFSNIPVKGNADYAEKTGKTLRLVASNKTVNAVFAGFNSDFTDGTGEGSTNIVKYIVNGYNKQDGTPAPDAKFYSDDQAGKDNDAYTVYTVNLQDWFPNGDTNNDGLLNANDDWKNALGKQNAESDVVVRKGSMLAGKFMFPFTAVEDRATLQLQLLSEDGTIIRIWNIRLTNSGASKDSQIDKKVSLVNALGNIVENGVVENNINYSIVRNHLYSVGVRNSGDNPVDPEDPDPTDPEDPIDPTDPDDKPQDLNNESLILRVNDNWEMIHNMEVD